MIARAYHPGDAAQLAALENSDVDPERDIIVVVEVGGKIIAAAAMRPVMFLHDLHLSGDMLKRQAIECCLAYGFGAARAAGHREALAVVSDGNTKMRGWLEEHGAKLQDPGAVYTVEIK
jgi:hypothetical protein